MNGPTHLLGGITAGLIASSVIGAHDAQTVVGVGVAAVGGLFPDWLSISFPFVRLPLEGHRGLTHCLLFAIVTSLLINPTIAPFWFAGLLSHMLLDLPSDAGMPLFWPLYPRRVALGWFRNGSAGEIVTRGLLCGMCAFVMLNWIR